MLASTRTPLAEFPMEQISFLDAESAGKRDPKMRQTKQGDPYYFGAKARIGVEEESGLVHSVVVTAANVADITQVDNMLHGKEHGRRRRKLHGRREAPRT